MRNSRLRRAVKRRRYHNDVRFWALFLPGGPLLVAGFVLLCLSVGSYAQVALYVVLVALLFGVTALCGPWADPRPVAMYIILLNLAFVTARMLLRRPGEAEYHRQLLAQGGIEAHLLFGVIFGSVLFWAAGEAGYRETG